MYYFIAIGIGALISLLVTANGGLAESFGSYSATVAIHIIGLLAASVIVAARRQRLIPRQKITLLFYLGGAVGVGTTLFNNLAFGFVSISALLALSLFGQTCTSLIVDQFGLLGMPKRPLRRAAVPGLLFAIGGIFCLIWPFQWHAVPAVLLGMLTGVTIVVARTINARLSESVGIWASTWWNFAVGLGLALCLLPLLGRGEPLLTGTLSLPLWFYWTGGIIGLVTVALSSVVVVKLPAFHVTLCMFAGQLGAGLLLDAVRSGSFSLQSCIGCLCAGIGILLTQRAGASAPAAKETP